MAAAADRGGDETRVLHGLDELLGSHRRARALTTEAPPACSPAMGSSAIARRRSIRGAMLGHVSLRTSMLVVIRAVSRHHLLLQGAGDILAEFQRQARIELPQPPGVTS